MFVSFEFVFLLVTYSWPISIRPPLLMADIHLSQRIPFAINQREGDWLVDTPVIRFSAMSRMIPCNVLTFAA